MQWGSLQEFIALGGYGGYVWPAYGITAVVMIIEVVLLVRRHQALRRARSERTS